ncbi:hypothetical protein P43SY_011473 [Pythium insidiosum]|uniref:Uncharacterized protein n=1 Tax=Pythium insidiosum TaxID=114742 RepID=A0AAD5LB67_PYTIN|nr:hypothetical protein P43SY_011473 [Pythium insidiosum]
MLENIDALRALPQLKRLRLSSWMVRDVTPLEGSVNCELLDLRQCNVSDLTPVGNLSRLGCLILDDTPVEDLSPLAQLAQLEHLSLARSCVRDVSVLETFQHTLRHLDLSGCNLASAGALRCLPRLQTLLLHETMWDSSVALSQVLSRLPSLTALDARTAAQPLQPAAPAWGFRDQVLQSLVALTDLQVDVRACEPAELQLGPVGLQRLSLDCMNRTVDDVPIALCALSRLSSLRLSRARIQGLHNLRALSQQLRELHLIDVRVSDISALQWLARLDVLVVKCVMVHCNESGDAPTHDLTPLARLRRLRHLDMNCTNLCDIQPLRHLDGLEYLDLSSTNVADASPVTALCRLETLHLRDTEIHELNGGDHCTRLREVSLPAQVDCTPVREHAPFLRRLLHPEINCLWTGHCGDVTKAQ